MIKVKPKKTAFKISTLKSDLKTLDFYVAAVAPKERMPPRGFNIHMHVQCKIYL